MRTSVASDAISDNLKKAIVATEDEHFNEHKGVVPKAVIRATLGTFVGLGSSSGGSTLTQQVIKQQVVGMLQLWLVRPKGLLMLCFRTGHGG